MTKNPAALVIGAIFIIVGIIALIHPRIVMPARKDEVEVSGQKLLIETQRIVDVPWYLSGLMVVAGAGFILLGPRESKGPR
jgi:hypothetical protein